MTMVSYVVHEHAVYLAMYLDEQGSEIGIDDLEVAAMTLSLSNWSFITHTGHTVNSMEPNARLAGAWKQG
jgi:hypothetical protein